ncbi:MAG: hypothetical protein K1X52_00125 [Pyrinomonadaceae bacterium]|nr:hypothetical protein [Pyrinomonadaceae bacterium]
MASALTNVRASSTDHPFSVLHSQFRCAGFFNALRFCVFAGAVLLCELCGTFAFFAFNEKGKRKERRAKPAKFAKKDF